MQISKISNSLQVNSARNNAQAENNCITPLQNSQINEIPNNHFNRYLVNFRGLPTTPLKRRFDLPKIINLLNDHFYHFEKAKFRHPEPNIVTGSNEYFKTLLSGNLEPFKAMKDSGLDAFIYLGSSYGEADCAKATELLKKVGLDFHPIPFSRFRYSNNYLIEDEVTGEFKGVKDEVVQDLKKFFELLRTKNVYMGCDQGQERTNIAIWLNHCLNTPKDTCSREFRYLDGRGEYVKGKEQAELLFKYLSEEQKSMLKIKDFNSCCRKISHFGEDFDSVIDGVLKDEKAKQAFTSKFNISGLSKEHKEPTMNELLAKYYDISESSVEPSIKRASELGISLDSYIKIMKKTDEMCSRYNMSEDFAADLVINKYLSTL